MNPFEAYHKSNIGVVNPVLAALLGYYGSRKFGRGLTRMAVKGKPPAVQRSIINAYRNIGDKKLGLLAGGTLGTLEALRTGTKYNKGLRDFVNSFLENKSGNPFESGYDSDAYSALLEPTRGINKLSSGVDPFKYKTVPVKDMIETVNTDNFLNTYDKLKTDSILYKSDEQKEGIVSGDGIAQTAIRAGVGFVPSYAFGRVMTGLAGFPKETRNRLASVGGIAGALYNTGMFSGE